MSSPDATAIMLLCSTLGRSSADCKPLTPRAYHQLASSLHLRQARPADLLGDARGELLRALEPGVDVSQLEALLSGGFALSLRLESWTRVGGWVMTRADPDYPLRLKRLGMHRPPVLFGIGHRGHLGAGGLAIVGSREVDSDDERFASGAAMGAVKHGLSVISGAAKGVDQVAMRAAIEAGGVVVGVVAERLADAGAKPSWRDGILQGALCLVSPFDPDVRFHTGNAMARNKVIYGLADGALVVRTGHEEGGTWSGAVENLKRKLVPLFVRLKPGAEGETGARALIRAGAIPVDDAWLASDVGTALAAAQLQAKGTDDSAGLFNAI